VGKEARRLRLPVCRPASRQIAASRSKVGVDERAQRSSGGGRMCCQQLAGCCGNLGGWLLQHQVPVAEAGGAVA